MGKFMSFQIYQNKALEIIIIKYKIDDEETTEKTIKSGEILYNNLG